MKIRVLGLLSLLIITSCASKKDILYLQDAESNSASAIIYQESTIQPNDILNITVETLVSEAAIPYNRGGSGNAMMNNVELMRLNGYFVSLEGTINFPMLESILVKNLTIFEVERKIEDLLVSGGHLKKPTVTVRLLNAKFTILGEVNIPGTYTFTEQNLTLLQALGFAGDLTINGNRNDIIITRDVDGIRKISHVDLTSTDFMSSEFYFIKPNDNIIVNQNNPRVKQSGFIGDISTVLTIASLALSITILLSR